MIFLALAGVAVGMAAAMLLTMSMYRAGLALMSCFVGLAGLFVLLDADLLAAIQIMMNVGGMLVMVLFMVMVMMDPGGVMMWEMKRSMGLRGPGALAMSMPRNPPPPPAPQTEHRVHRDGGHDWTCPMHPEVSNVRPGECPKCGMALVPRAEAQPTETHDDGQRRQHGEHASHDRGDMSAMGAREHHQMMVDMAMSTTQLPWALAIGAVSAIVLVVLAVRTPWPLASGGPTHDATAAVGELLLSRYMLAFEGAAFLILAGMVAAVIFGKNERPVSRGEP